MKKRVVFILGPTGAGKSDFAVRLAKSVNGEIISCDSMQVYKGMSIISQQPPDKLLKSVSHHLIGTLSPSREWSAAHFVEKAGSITGRIISKDKTAIIAGGTGLYARSFINGLFPAPEKDEKYRGYLKKVAERKGRRYLYDMLRKIDPAYAAKIHENDLQRIIRVLEIYKLTGKRISQEHAKTVGIRNKYNTLVVILTRSRGELYKIIDERVEKMFRGGVVNEVRALRRRKLSKTAEAVLGYREICNYLDGNTGLSETKEVLKRKTRQYAKRQLTWFRKDSDAIWLNMGHKTRHDILIRRIKGLLLKGG